MACCDAAKKDSRRRGNELNEGWLEPKAATRPDGIENRDSSVEKNVGSCDNNQTGPAELPQSVQRLCDLSDVLFATKIHGRIRFLKRQHNRVRRPRTIPIE